MDVQNNAIQGDEGDSEQQIWKQMPGEPDKWFERFNYFRLLGANRSIYKAWIVELGRTGAKKSVRKGTPGVWCKQSKLWNWEKRARAFDEYRRQRDEEKWEKRRAELLEREWEISLALDKKLMQMLEFPLASTKREQTIGEDGKVSNITTIEPARWGFGDAARIAEARSKIGRLASGMDTSRETVTVNNKPRTANEMTDDELAAIAARGTTNPGGSGTDNSSPA